MTRHIVNLQVKLPLRIGSHIYNFLLTKQPLLKSKHCTGKNCILSCHIFLCWPWARKIPLLTLHCNHSKYTSIQASTFFYVKVCRFYRVCIFQTFYTALVSSLTYYLMHIKMTNSYYYEDFRRNLFWHTKRSFMIIDTREDRYEGKKTWSKRIPAVKKAVYCSSTTIMILMMTQVESWT